MPDYLKRVLIIFFAALAFASVMYYLNEIKFRSGVEMHEEK